MDSRSFPACLLVCFALLVHGAAAARAPVPAQAPLRVLLVGNSYTKFNVMPRLLQRLSAAVPGVRALHVDFETHGGYSLRTHWLKGLAPARIRSGRYDAVVLQSHSLSAVDHPDELDEYAQRFKQLIDQTGARTVLYETWARKDGARLYRTHERLRTFSEMSAIVGDVYTGLALRLGVGLAPVGRAFEQELGAGDIELYRSDASHPTPAGSFLAACVLYGALTGEDPRSSGYVPFGLAQSAALQLKAVAAAALARAPGAPPAPVAPVAPAPEPPAPAIADAVASHVADTGPANEAEPAVEAAEATQAIESAEAAEAVESAEAAAAAAAVEPPALEPLESVEPVPPDAVVAPVSEPVAAAPPAPPAP